MKKNKVKLVVLTFVLTITTILNGSSVFAEENSTSLDAAHIKTERKALRTRSISGDFEYEEVNGNIKITKYKGDALTITIPEEINGKKVTILGTGSFSSSPDKWLQVKKVVLPDTVTIIESAAFSGNQYLEDVKLSTSLEKIDEGAFGGSALSSIELPSSLTYIGNNAFGFCEFTSMELSNSITIEKTTIDEPIERIFHAQRGPSIYAVKDDIGWYIDLKDIDEKIELSRIKSVRAATVSPMGNTYSELSQIDGTYDKETGIIRFTSDPTDKNMDYEYQVQMSEAGELNLMNVTVKIETIRNAHMVNFEKEGINDLKVVVGNKYKNLPNLAKIGYVALWNTKKDGTGLDITNESIVTVDAPHTLFPKYMAKSYEVTFHANEGMFVNNEFQRKQITFDQVYGELPQVKCEGFELIGWNTKSDGSGDYVVEDTIMNRDENHELYAIYKKSPIQLPGEVEKPDPSDPSEPTNPDKPNEPSIPNQPDQPEVPDNPDRPSEPDNKVDTGDTSTIVWYSSCTILALGMMLAVKLYRRNKNL